MPTLIAIGERLRSERCVVRRWAARDREPLVRIANDESVARYLRHAFPSPYTMEEADDWLALARTQGDRETNFAIDDGDDLAGGIGVMFGRDIHRGTAEIGYWLGRSSWGRGLARGALGLLTDRLFAATATHRIWAGVAAPNVASTRVLTAAGYVREATLRSAVTLRTGEIVDEIVYARLRDRVPDV